MPERPLLESPLVAVAESPPAGPVRMSERPFLGHFNLRGSSGDPAFVDACQAAIGLAPPAAANTFAEHDGRTLAWLGPDEWLLLTPAEDRDETATHLRRALAGRHASVVDISGGQTVIRLEGGGTRAMLARGCPLDLHPRTFATGRCAQSRIDQTNALLLRRADHDCFEVIVRRSFADYLWRWLSHVNGALLP